MIKFPLILSLILTLCCRAETKIGVYDSRSVAIAFAGSPSFTKWMAPLYEEMKEAQADKDQEKILKLNKQGQARQEMLHKQGFYGAPVDNILEHLKTKLPAIQKKAGVTALVSKWDKKQLAKFKDAKQIDVTMALVDALEPTKKQRQTAIEIQKKKPLFPKK